MCSSLLLSIAAGGCPRCCCCCCWRCVLLCSGSSLARRAPTAVAGARTLPPRSLTIHLTAMPLMQTYAFYAMVLVAVLNRLPLKLPQRGAGRRHANAAAQPPVTFDVVAGVDEA